MHCLSIKSNLNFQRYKSEFRVQVNSCNTDIQFDLFVSETFQGNLGSLMAKLRLWDWRVENSRFQGRFADCTGLVTLDQSSVKSPRTGVAWKIRKLHRSGDVRSSNCQMSRGPWVVMSWKIAPTATVW
ncbi:hypothetical protein AVEN_169981-1 [Araneus ventricosus]|uniref:Uncharacterized protein n=1 Tax=Araneus ventricosus TaxID=182803 RepID=A0A4Y2VLD7_ARAVE|nr:hypothetical protein AVEN_169981-1 [Araneus ventricosus]